MLYYYNMDSVDSYAYSMYIMFNGLHQMNQIMQQQPHSRQIGNDEVHHYETRPYTLDECRKITKAIYSEKPRVCLLSATPMASTNDEVKILIEMLTK